MLKIKKKKVHVIGGKFLNILKTKGLNVRKVKKYVLYRNLVRQNILQLSRIFFDYIVRKYFLRQIVQNRNRERN